MIKERSFAVITNLGKSRPLLKIVGKIPRYLEKNLFFPNNFPKQKILGNVGNSQDFSQNMTDWMTGHQSEKDVGKNVGKSQNKRFIVEYSTCACKNATSVYGTYVTSLDSEWYQRSVPTLSALSQ